MEDYDKIKKVLALGFMHFLDENRPEGKMCLSNGECADIEKAFNEQEWPKLSRYLDKYLIDGGSSEIPKDLEEAAKECNSNLQLQEYFIKGGIWQKEQMMIQWTGNNLKDLIEFTGKSPRFNEWFKSWDDYEDYVRQHGNIFKMFNDDGSHLEVPVGAWIVKTPDKRCVASKFTLKQPESEKIAAAYQLGLADKEKQMKKELRSYCLDQMELFPGEGDVARATRAVYYDIIGYLDNYERR